MVARGVAAHAEPASAPADAVALLPLDAERSLEIYGQPVASEIARALGAGHVAVVVVGPKMAMPERARLIIDGTISLGKASAVTISLRVRNTADGVVVETLSATAPGLAKIDTAAAELSARILPIVRDKLAALHPEDHGRVVQVRPGAPVSDAPPERPVLVAVGDARAQPGRDALARAFDTAVAGWIRAQHREPRKVDAGTPDHKAATGAGELAFAFWIVDYTDEPGPPPMARARVRVQIARDAAVVFDRVVATDTVLGEVGRPAELADRVAREVLAILRPHVRRSVAWWR
jgi:hypothetical protein